ncbi:hypothetical protein E0Z07_07790 [Myroides odoratimimus]|nr:hypothetical protein E0Z07_07790 [Myroides odoratimimus]
MYNQKATRYLVAFFVSYRLRLLYF